MKNAFRCLWLTGLVALPLAACNQTASTDPIVTGSISTGSISAPDRMRVTSSAVPVPGGSGCRGEINRYKVVTSSDQAKGQVDQTVFDQITREINDAELACLSGRDAESMRMMSASKARHGYL